MKIPVSEMFYSLEGEGPLAGQPTLFLRTWGCNFTCSGFSNPGVIPITFEGAKQERFDRGCDTAYAWHKDFASLIKRMEVRDVAHALRDLLPVGLPADTVHLSLTGGEPMLHQKALIELLNDLDDLNVRLRDVLIETNGSQLLDPSWAEQNFPFEIVFSVSPKLSNSGEDPAVAIRPDIIATYEQVGSYVYLKFVSNGTDENFEEIERVQQRYADDLPMNHIDFWVMPEAATPEQLKLVGPKVAEQCLKRGWNYSGRLHIDLWDNKAGT